MSKVDAVPLSADFVLQCVKNDTGGWQFRQFKPERPWVAATLPLARLPDAICLCYNRLMRASLPEIGDVVLMLGDVPGGKVLPRIHALLGM